jgi:hypothetical protein
MHPIDAAGGIIFIWLCTSVQYIAMNYQTFKPKESSMPQISSTPQHCPGFDKFKNLKSFICRCNECGNTKEIFSDEFDRPHTCGKCGTAIDFSQCTLDAQAGTSDPR